MDGRTLLEVKLTANMFFTGVEITGSKKVMKVLNLEDEDIKEVIDLLNEKIKKRNPNAHSEVIRQEEPTINQKEILETLFDAIRESFKEEYEK